MENNLEKTAFELFRHWKKNHLPDLNTFFDTYFVNELIRSKENEKY